MKKILFGLLLTWSFAAKAQVYNNEWIDYSKTYYKFKIGATGLYRISQSVLSSSGLGNTSAENFQLWCNGKQIPIYISVPTGILSASDYIEFWGKMNDGKADKELYRNTDWQLNDKWSLETDTAAYFLTVNTNTANNFRLQDAPNNVAGNSLPAEPYFMYTIGKYFKDKINPGYAVNVGEYLYSSSYDKGEGWSSQDITSTANAGGTVYGTNSFIFNNLFVYNGGPSPKFKIALSGNTIATRRYRVTINSDSVIGNEMDFLGYNIDSTGFSLSTLNTNAVTVSVTNFANIGCYPLPVGCQTDRIVVHKYEITYPRQFNFGGAANFEFTMPASTGNFLQISNFSYGASTPVLYDLTNGNRYVADLSAAPDLKFVLAASTTERQFVLVSEESSNQIAVSSLQTRNFINYTAAANQGNYLIISSPVLFNGANGTNPVNDYRLYRSSAAGGSFNAKIYLADELVDQFGFGIKKNPAAIRNFIRYARINYATTPKQVFIIGKGLSYVEQRNNESATYIDQLNLVPSFGWPASDVLLTAEPGSSIPEIPVGRLSAINAPEVALYLKKIKEFELAQATQSPLIQNKAWIKNVVHIIGASDEGLTNTLTQYMDSYKQIISDTLYGANVSTFSKSTTDAVEQLNSSRLQNLFSDGISIITYFGHSSSTTLEFNLDNPQNYNNFGKYPLFIGLGCNAGNFFNYNPVRLQTDETISEKYVLAPDRGTIGFIASTHFGIVHYLNIWNTNAYQELAYKSYGKSIGEIMKYTVEDVFNITTQEDFYARCNAEQTELHGDPAIQMNTTPKPDYVIEDAMLRITPGFISVANDSFRVDAKMLNMGKALSKSVIVEVKRKFPDQSVSIIRDTIPGIRYADSISLELPINSTHDKGLNQITVTIDPDNLVDELYKTNNSVTKNVMIYEDEARPVYPYNFAIVGKQNIKLKASTANPFSISKQYVMEMDTTELFNSSFKISKNVTTVGGVMEFDPGIVFTDSTVYYWRVAPAVTTGSPVWNTSSFVYLAGSDAGYNQSHLFQHLKSTIQRLSLDSSSRLWKFGIAYQNLFVKIGTWATSIGQEAGVSVAVNSNPYIRNTCAFQSVVFNVFDPVTFQPWVNTSSGPANYYGGGKYGSATNFCNSGRQNNFEYRWDSATGRKRAMDFMSTVIPDSAYVVVRSFLLDPVTFPGYAYMLKYASDWQADTASYGSGQSLYHYLKNAGFSGIDSFSRPRNFVLIYRKNDPSFVPKWIMTDGTYDNMNLSADCAVSDSAGDVTSPQFGPAKKWKLLNWKGYSMENTPGDMPTVDVIGIKYNGGADTLIRSIDPTQPTTDLSGINPVQYPYLQLHLHDADQVTYTPYQLKYWRLTYDPAPEGAVAPNTYFKMKDTLDVAEPLDFQMAFKNISDAPFDSLKIKMIVTDRNNVQHVLPVFKQRPLAINNPDTIHVHYIIDTRQLVGANTLYVEVNPDNDQPEQYHFNNFIYRSFYVRGDTLKPLLDVTFDNVHILNHDIVASKPSIVIKLKDEAKWFLLDSNSVLNLQVRYPDGSLHPYSFNSDTLQFIPAQQAPNTNNTASAIFKPYFPQDGEYELIVTGKDMSQNQAGNMEYRVSFNVINKPMISNMLNYPNPFTTSTAFVFTVTGSVVPQNIKIEILTVTGKIVREITKDELGPIHIGRNITEFKWDGTDQYGEKLGNGVYLYRVVTNLNGKSLDKYTANGDNTDKYFIKGYGKMYLMR